MVGCCRTKFTCGQFIALHHYEWKPHEIFFSYRRRTLCGEAIPSWLSFGRPALLRFVRFKSDPLVDQVKVVEANETYAKIRIPDGRQSTMSTSDLAPRPPRSNCNLDSTAGECGGTACGIGKDNCSTAPNEVSYREDERKEWRCAEWKSAAPKIGKDCQTSWPLWKRYSLWELLCCNIFQIFCLSWHGRMTIYIPNLFCCVIFQRVWLFWNGWIV